MLTIDDHHRRYPAQRRSRRRGGRLFNAFVLVTLLISALLLALTFLQRDSPSDASPGQLSGDPAATFAVLDVGQGLSAAIVTEDGHGLVYDFGVSRAGAEDVVIPFLDDHDVDRIGYAILSHPHQDHLGGLPALLDAIPVDTYLDPVIETTNQTYLQSLEIIESKGIATGTARQGDSYTLGERVEFEILWPPAELLTDSSGEPEINGNSTVVRATVGDVDILLTGDIEAETEQILAGSYGEDLDTDVLQVAHHGSNDASTGGFLRFTNPEVGIIPVGADNSYGHPHPEVIERLRTREIQIYSSDVDGTVMIQTDGDQYEVTPSRTGQGWATPASWRHWTGSSGTTRAMPWVSSLSTEASN